ncbi:MAG: ATP-binding protein, partial [Candidatus Krumholzibacteriia bacterium]
ARVVAQLLQAQPGLPPVTVHAAAGLPPALANREQVRQVLLNLALNAGTAAGPGGRADLVIDRTGDGLRCRVRDDGPGFSAEALANFGTPFFSTREGGTGLGLATSLRLVEDQGGSLAVVTDHPEGAQGACVQMILPVAPPTRKD